MKMRIVLLLCTLNAMALSVEEEEYTLSISTENDKLDAGNPRGFLVNALIRQMFTYVRYLIKHGSTINNTPPLDPLELEQFHFNLPAAVINLDLDLKNILATGFGDFVVHRSNLNLKTLAFDIEISVPKLEIYFREYDLSGNLYTAIPLYGKGKAKFEVDGYIFRAILFLKQSENGKSVIIDRIESSSFEVPGFKSDLTGVIGGGDIDSIANAITDKVIIDYMNRFQAVIARYFSDVVIKLGNPVLNQLNTWRFLAPFLPKPLP